MLKGAFKECASSLAIVCANTQPEPGVALKPPVPQPQLKYRPLILSLIHNVVALILLKIR